MSVTPGRRSSLWMYCQSGIGRAWVGGAGSLSNSSASKAASLRSSGSGQDSPTAFARRRWSATVVNGTPKAAPTTRWDKPWPQANRRMSRTLRIARRGLGTATSLGAELQATVTGLLSSHADPYPPPTEVYENPQNRRTDSTGTGVRNRPESAVQIRSLTRTPVLFIRLL